MDIAVEIVKNIIREQQMIMGPIALREAAKVPGLKAENLESISIIGDKKEVVEKLVQQYARLFGKASVQISKEAIEPMMDKLGDFDLPTILKD